MNGPSYKCDICNWLVLIYTTGASCYFSYFYCIRFFLIRKIKIFKRVLQVSYEDEDGKKQDTATIQFPATNARNAML